MKKAVPTSEDIRAQIKSAAKMYEKQFVGEMIKAMRSSVQESGLITKNPAEKLFSEEMDQHYAQQWSDQGSLSLATMIENQIIDRYGEKWGLKENPLPVRGPLPLSAKDLSKGAIALTAKDQMSGSADSKNESSVKGYLYAKENKLDSMFNLPASADGEGHSVTNPWSGSVQKIPGTREPEQIYLIKHDNGLESRLAFQGKSLLGFDAQFLEAGAELGKTSADAGSLFWSLRKF